jgi:hypothetical protein
VGINPIIKGPVPSPAAGTAPISLGIFHQQQAPLDFARNNVYNSGMPSHAALVGGVHTLYEPAIHHSLTAHPEFSVRAQMNQDKSASAWSPQQAGLFFAQTQMPQWAPQLSSANHNEQSLIANNGGGHHAASILPSHYYFLHQQRQRQLRAQSEQDDSSSVDSVSSVDSNILGSGIARSISSSGISSDSYEMNIMNERPVLGYCKPSSPMGFPGSTWAVQESPAIASAGGVNCARHVNATIPVMI